MSDQRFKKGDLIFAKMRGYPAWPARVEELATDSPNPKNARYKVFFYGTYQTGVCKPEEMCDFIEKKQKLGTPKKNRGFNDAMREIEENPNIQPPPQVDIKSDSESEEESFIPALPEKIVFPDSSSETRKRAKPEPSPVVNKKPKLEPGRQKVKAESDAGVKKEVKVEAGAEEKKELKPLPSDDEEELAKSEEMDPDFFDDKEVTLDFSEEEDDDEPSPDYSDIEPEDFADNEVKEDPDELLKFTLSRRDALNMLDCPTLPHTLYRKIERVLRKQQIKRQRPEYIYKQRQLKFLRLEVKLSEADKQLKKYLSCSNMKDGDKALAVLHKLLTFQYIPLMLKKEARVVETIKKVTRYVGPREGFADLSAEDKIKFLDTAASIREKASHVLLKMQACFTVPPGVRFYRWFMEQARELRKMVTTVRELILLIDDPTVIDFERPRGDPGDLPPPLHTRRGAPPREEEEQDSESEDDLEFYRQLCKEEILDDETEGQELCATFSRPPLQPLAINNDLNEQPPS